MSSLVVEISDQEDDDFCIKANCPSCGNTCQDYGENSDSFNGTGYPLTTVVQQPGNLGSSNFIINDSYAIVSSLRELKGSPNMNITYPKEIFLYQNQSKIILNILCLGAVSAARVCFLIFTQNILMMIWTLI
jgi:hypothetical protein